MMVSLGYFRGLVAGALGVSAVFFCFVLFWCLGFPGMLEPGSVPRDLLVIFICSGSPLADLLPADADLFFLHQQKTPMAIAASTTTPAITPPIIGHGIGFSVVVVDGVGVAVGGGVVASSDQVTSQVIVIDGRDSTEAVHVIVSVSPF